MQNKSSKFIFLLLLSCTVITSCRFSITKRKYNPGYFLESSSLNQKYHDQSSRHQNEKISSNFNENKTKFFFAEPSEAQTILEASSNAQAKIISAKTPNNRIHNYHIFQPDPCTSLIFTNSKHVTDTVIKKGKSEIEKIRRNSKTAHTLSVIGLICLFTILLLPVSLICAIIAKKMTSKILATQGLDSGEMSRIKDKAQKDNKRAKATLWVFGILLFLIIALAILAFLWFMLVFLKALKGS